MKKFILVFLFSVCLVNFGFSQRNCPAVTNMLHAGTPYVNVISLNMSQTIVTFYTNFVCGATSYTWVIDGLYTVNTSSNTITMSAQDFLWLPASGCSGFNSKLVLYPLQDYGVYTTTFSVKSDITPFISIPVQISGVPKCVDSRKEKFYLECYPNPCPEKPLVGGSN